MRIFNYNRFRLKTTIDINWQVILTFETVSPVVLPLGVGIAIVCSAS